VVRQVKPEMTSKLTWVLPVVLLPPPDVDPTDLFLDHNVHKCSLEIAR
jgi:hypothetical protein